MAPRLAVWLTSFALVVGVGARAQRSAAVGRTPDALARLVPADCSVFLQVASLEALDEYLEGFEGLVPDHLLRSIGSEALLDQLLAAGIARELVDRARPIGVALGGDELAATIVLPIAEAERALAGWSPPRPGIAVVPVGDYAGFSTAEDYAASDRPAVFARLPTECFALRADVAQLFASHGPTILAAIEAWRPPSSRKDAAAAFRSVALSLLARLVREAELLELSVERSGPEYQLDLVVGLRPESALVGKPREGFSPLLGVDGSFGSRLPIALVAAVDAGEPRQLLAPIFDAWCEILPDARRDAARELRRTAGLLWPRDACGFALAWDLSGPEPRFHARVDAPDPGAALDEAERLLLAPGSWLRADAPFVEGPGGSRAAPVACDAERLALLLGCSAQRIAKLTDAASGLSLRAAQGGAVLAVGERDGLGPEASGAGGSSFGRAVERVRDARPAFVLRFDPARTGCGGTADGSQHPEPITLYAGRLGAELRAGVSGSPRALAGGAIGEGE